MILYGVFWLLGLVGFDLIFFLKFLLKIWFSLLFIVLAQSLSCVKRNGAKQRVQSAGLSFNFLPTVILRAYAPVKWFIGHLQYVWDYTGNMSMDGY